MAAKIRFGPAAGRNSPTTAAVRLKPLMEQVRARGMGAVALTDLNNMFALVKHYKAALAQGVKKDATALLTACGLALRSFD